MVRKAIDARRRQQKFELRRSRSARNANANLKSEKPEEEGNLLEDGKKHEPHVYSSEMDGTPCMLYIHVSSSVT